MDATLVIPLAGGLALGAVTGGLFYGSLRLSVAAMLAGPSLPAMALQLARFGGLALGLYAAARLGAPALLAAGAACVGMRAAVRKLTEATS
jgi:hypothetical protein